MKNKKECANEKSYKSSTKFMWIGIISAMASALIFGLNPLFVTSASNGGCNDIAFIFYSTLFAIPVMIVIMCLLRISFLPMKKEILPILGTGIFSSVTTILLFSSYSHVATGIATTLHFTYPTFVAIGSIFVLRQRLTKGKMIALLVSLAGICLVADFSGAAGVKGIILALSSGVTYAGYILMMDKTGLKNMNFLKVCFYMAVIKVIFTWCYGISTNSLSIHPSMSIWGILSIYGLVATIGAIVLFQVGVRYSGGSNAAIFSMFEPVTSLIIGFLVMNEMMTGRKWFGCGLILTGIVVTIIEERKSKK